MQSSTVTAKPEGSPGSTLTVTLHVTRNCNLRCAYCYAGAKAAVSMSPDIALKAVDFSLKEAARQGVATLEVVFFGGEPLFKIELIYSIIEEFRARARGLDLAFKLCTNATLLTDRLLTELAERRVYVAVSIDGDPTVQDHQRPDARGRPSSPQIERMAGRLLELNPCTNVTTVVTPWSAAYLDASVRWLYDKGFAYITTTLDYAADWSDADFRRLQAAYERLAAWYVARTRERDRMYLSCFDERIRTRTRGPLGEGERCDMGYHHFSIAPSGRIYPCVQFVRDDTCLAHVIGDVSDGFNPNRDRIRACAARDKTACKGCALESRCANWCSCINWQSTGRIDAVSPVLCRHEQILFPIADAIGNTLWKQRNALFMHKHYNPAFPVLEFVETVAIKEVRHAYASSSI